MTLFQKIYGMVFIIITSAALGYTYGKGDVETVIQERVVTKEGEEKIVFKDRVVIVTKEVKPDGTITETTTTKESDKITEKKKSSTESKTDSTTKPSLAQYRLGISAVSNWQSIREIKPTYEVSASTRVGSSPFFIRSAVTPELKQVTLGLEIEL